MKRAISILLVLVMALSLCACGAKSALESTLVGEWKSTDINYLDRTLVFLDSGKGKFVQDSSGFGGDFLWEVQNGKVYILTYDSGSIGGLGEMYKVNGTSLIHPDGTVAFRKN